MDYNQDIFFKMQQQQMPGKQPFYMTNPIQNLYMTELEYQRDLDRMKEMYPMEIRKVQELVEEECDKLEYAGSPMFAEYPDPEVIRKIARDVYAELPDPYVDIHLDMEAAPSEPPYVPKGKGCGNCMMRNLIETLICNEFYCRRERYRRCRRRFYL